MKPTRDIAQANRIRWFLAAHLLAVLGIFEASLWVAEHLATRPDPMPAAHALQPAVPERPQPQQPAWETSLVGRSADDGDAGRWRQAAQREVAYDDRPGASPVTRLP